MIKNNLSFGENMKFFSPIYPYFAAFFTWRSNAPRSGP